jgi:hypothetical protein
MTKIKTKRYEGTSIKKGFGNSKTGRQRDPDWRDNVEMGAVTDGEFMELRPVGDIYKYAQHWVEFKKRDGTKGRFPVTCRNYNSETESFDSSQGCPCCKRQVKTRIMTNCNYIVRSLQEDRPAKAKIEVASKGKKFRVVGDKSWSPVRVFSFPGSVAEQLKDVYALNKHKIKDPETGEKTMVACEPADPKYGCDVRVKFDSTKDAASMYNVQKADHTPLTEEEESYLLFDLDCMFYPDKDEMEKKLAELLDGAKDKDEDDDDDNDEVPPPRKKGKSKIDADDDDEKPAKKKKKPVDEDDDEDEKPAKKKKKPAEDDDDDADDDTDDEDEKPAKKKKKPAEDDDADEDEKPAKKKKKPAEDDDDDADDDDEKPAKKKGSKPKCYGAYKRKSECFECDYRLKCIDASKDGDDDEDDAGDDD